jgi:hypothetical protein
MDIPHLGKAKATVTMMSMQQALKRCLQNKNFRRDRSHNMIDSVENYAIKPLENVRRISNRTKEN